MLPVQYTNTYHIWLLRQPLNFGFGCHCYLLVPPSFFPHFEMPNIFVGASETWICFRSIWRQGLHLIDCNVVKASPDSTLINEGNFIWGDLMIVSGLLHQQFCTWSRFLMWHIVTLSANAKISFRNSVSTSLLEDFGCSFNIFLDTYNAKMAMMYFFTIQNVLNYSHVVINIEMQTWRLSTRFVSSCCYIAHLNLLQNNTFVGKDLQSLLWR